MDKTAHQINLLIKDNGIYQAYLSSKKRIENNVELNELQNRMKELKNQNCKWKNEDLIYEYYKLEKEYKSNILIKEYEVSKESIYSLFVEICDILSFK